MIWKQFVRLLFVDVESEKMLAEGLLPLVPDTGFYGEESGKKGSHELVWIVDPLEENWWISGVCHTFLSNLYNFCHFR